MEEKKTTLGEVILSLANQTPEMVAVADLVKAQTDNYERDFRAMLDKGMASFRNDFYIEVRVSKDAIADAHGVLVTHTKVLPCRETCPMPAFNQCVYKYHYSEDRLEVLWAIPDSLECVYYKVNALKVVPAERQYLQFILDFLDRTLDREAQKLNGPDIIITD